MQLVLIITVIGAALAAARHFLLYNVRQCKSCRGFGIQRYAVILRVDRFACLSCAWACLGMSGFFSIYLFSLSFPPSLAEHPLLL